MTTKQKVTWGVIILIVVALVVWWKSIKPPTLKFDTYPVTYLDTGFTPEVRKTWHRTPEGSEMLPLSFFQSLIDKKSGRPFIEILPRFGFLPDADNIDGLPVGWSSHQDTILNNPVRNIGLNCAACHTGEISYKGNHYRIDGAPNMVDVEAFAEDLKVSLESTLKNPVKGFTFIRNVIRLNHDDQKNGEFLELDSDTMEFIQSLDPTETSDDKPDQEIATFIGNALSDLSYRSVIDLKRHHANFDESIAEEGGDTPEIREHVGEVLSTLHSYRDFFQTRIQFVHRLQTAMDDQTDPGPGRADSFDLIRDLLWAGEHRIAMSAPVSIPDLFSLDEMEYIHWDGNTNSIMQRNIAQAVALGAYYDEKTNECHVLPRNIQLLEVTARKLRPPKWPEEHLGKLDQEKIARGKVLWEKNCVSCHGEENVLHHMPGRHSTDMTRITNFNQMLGDQPFPHALAEVAAKMEDMVFKAHNITGEEAEKMRGKKAEWLVTTGYYPRSLHGVWATAPFLHNASVPTLYDLLLPDSERPTSFPVGHREFDPVKVGYITDPEEVRWTMDTKPQGNSNRGHNFGTELSDPERMDLIEFLKTL